ncbi:PAS domain S-box protein [Sphaerotilus sp.]|uniref:PAS domain S-box protein n=1 Tax=Sphaerotilus sp. TaxID=2093942 RepID=UPI0034E1D753
MHAPPKPDPGSVASPGTPTRQQSREEVSRVVMLYALASVLWIILSDTLVQWLLPDPVLRAVAGTFKGWVFIGVTAVALYGLLLRSVERGHRAFDRERAAWRQRDDAMALLQSLVDASPDAIFVKDRTGRYQLFNEAAARLVGKPVAQVIGQDDRALFDADQAAMVLANDQQVMAMGQDLTFEEVLDTVAGQRTFQALKGPLRGSDGQVTGMYGISRDITPRRLAERALQVSEQRYRLAASHGQVWDWSADTGQLIVAPEFWHAQGLPVPTSDNSLRQFEASLHPEDLPCFRTALTAHLRRQARYRLEFRMRHADGSWRWFHTQGQAVWDQQGRAIYMAGTTFEITERKGAEDALRESEAYRRLVFEQLADGVLLIDNTLMVLDANPQALAMLGYTRAELLRLSLHDLLAGHERPRLEAERVRLLSGGTYLDEWEHRRRDGTQFPAEVSVRSLDGQRHVQVLRDITGRRASEKALLTYQLELSELTQRLLEQEKQTTQRVAQSLHDHVGQTLAVIRLNLDAAQATYGALMPAGLKQTCSGLAQMLDQVVREVRLVLVDLRPPLLEAQGLVAAIDNEIRARVLPGVGGDASVDVLIEVSDEVAARRWPADVEYGVFMVAREAIANARQHAGASLIRVILGADTGSGTDGLALDVLDDGHGIPAPMQQGRPGHLGIVGMRERAIAIGARFSVGPGPDGGTQVTLRWQASKA